MRVLHEVVIAGIALALVSATPALAGGKRRQRTYTFRYAGNETNRRVDAEG